MKRTMRRTAVRLYMIQIKNESVFYQISNHSCKGQPQGIAPTTAPVGAIPCGCPSYGCFY